MYKRRRHERTRRGAQTRHATSKQELSHPVKLLVRRPSRPQATPRRWESRGKQGLYREVLFELVNGKAATPLFQSLSADATARTRLQAASLSHDVVTVLVDHAGPASSVSRVRDVAQGPPQPYVLHYDTLVDEEKRIRFMVTWRRPPNSGMGVSLEHLLHDKVGPVGLLFGRIEGGVIAYKAASPDGRGLTEFLGAVQAAFGNRFTVRPLRAGPFRPGWEIEDAPRRVDPDDKALLAAALASGYYDEPKRCGVRELGDALGVSKSVVARRLRDLERRALEMMVS